jgi:LysR family transcriptional regulator, glycine cleavage system transcriptional activator
MMGITAGAASRQLRALEQAMGCPMFNREGGRLVPIPAAKAFQDEVVASFDRLQVAVATLRDIGNGPLVVGVLPSFLLLWLVPRLPALTRAYPDLAVVPRPLDGPIDLVSAGLDAIIDVGRWPSDQALIRTGFMDDTSGPVLSAQLHQDLGCPTTMEGLMAAPLLESRSRPGLWDPWLDGVEQDVATSARRIGFDHLLYALEAARAGLGVAIGPTAYLHAGLAKGELVAPLGFKQKNLGYHVAWSQHKSQDLRLQTFVRWLRAEGAATPTAM